jgi:hypothetical protein
VTGQRTARLTATGHPAVTGGHGKTLELTAGSAITERASCIVGVATNPLPGALPTLRGRVRLELTTGERTAVVEGDANPSFASPDRLVVRRSAVLDPDTFLVNATAAAGDLDRDLVAELSDPGTRLEVTATELTTPDPVVLVLTGSPVPPSSPIATLAAQVDLVVDLTGAGTPRPAIDLPARRVHGVPETTEAVRTTVVLAADPAAAAPAVPPGARVVLWPPTPGADLLLAAGLPPTPAVLAGSLPRAAATATALAATTLVLDSVDGAGIAPLRDRLPEHLLVLPDPAVGWGVKAYAVAPGQPLDDSELAGLARSPTLALVPPPDRPGPLAVDPAALAAALRSAGLSGRDAAAVLAALGVGRREAYRLAAER